MMFMRKLPSWCRLFVALLSLAAMTLVFVMPAAWVSTWCGWLPRAQLLPAIMAGELWALTRVAVSVMLFGRLYCLVVCPLGIAQDVARLPFKLLRIKGLRVVAWMRYAVLALFTSTGWMLCRAETFDFDRRKSISILFFESPFPELK